MEMTKTEYARLAKSASPPTHAVRNCVVAFLVGGAICALGELLTHLYGQAGMPVSEVKIAVPATLIVLAAVATGLKVYDSFAVYAGAGTLVPITGFANAMVAPALEFKSEGHIMGIGARMFSIAGPVIVFGVIASVVYGIILCLFKAI